MEKNLKRREMYLTGLVLVALYLSLAENFIPKPFPWMKLGLSNIAVLIALEKFDSKFAMELVLLRIFIQALMLGTLFTPGFIISLTAGALTTLFMIGLYKFRDHLSLIAISSMSAFLHNLIQLIVVYFLMFRNVSIYSKSIMGFVWVFLLIGVIAGVITGFIAEKLNLRRSNTK
ncbi:MULTISPECIES: Gx transporter family protein [Fusobacterium]|jgi:heptaprenyl diphosphate synthase|uniref:Gx transporter family protein n=1 Tax=Fusobacterium hominis TaxID=2764326 RepID=A0A7G9GV48_9FUSO|nr:MULTISPECIES: Gx transporter family protein [Fusobacterium]QNM14680.1 Gx transporter family protein [Fusobacterium hominis]